MPSQRDPKFLRDCFRGGGFRGRGFRGRDDTKGLYVALLDDVVGKRFPPVHTHDKLAVGIHSAGSRVALHQTRDNVVVALGHVTVLRRRNQFPG